MGATEVKPPKLAGRDCLRSPSTGTFLRANNLRIVDEVIQSTTGLIANKQAYAGRWKKQKIRTTSP